MASVNGMRLAETVTNLAREVGKLRTLMAESYVTKVEHLREIDRLEGSIAEHAERWREDLDRHRRECAGR